jgi:hypothetical protein
MKYLKNKQKKSFGKEVSITFSKNKSKPSRKNLYTNSSFFSEECVVKFNDEFITFTKTTIDSTEKTVNFTSQGDYCLFNASVFDGEFEIPIGKFHFDEEESNEDSLIVYFN